MAHAEFEMLNRFFFAGKINLQCAVFVAFRKSAAKLSASSGRMAIPINRSPEISSGLRIVGNG